VTPRSDPDPRVATAERPETKRRRRVRDAAPAAGVDAEDVRRRLLHRSARIERRAVEEALPTLDARGELTDEQRRLVRLLGARLTRRLTAVPEAALERGDPGGDESVRPLARLFGVAHDIAHEQS